MSDSYDFDPEDCSFNDREWATGEEPHDEDDFDGHGQWG